MTIVAIGKQLSSRVKNTYCIQKVIANLIGHGRFSQELAALRNTEYIQSMNYKELIRDVPDFPIAGVLFRDVSPLLQNAEAFSQVATDFSKLIDLKNVDLFVGIESRGFIFAAQMAGKFHKGFLPLRKAGKLPPPVHQESYDLEYGKATLEIAPAMNRMKVIICDDVLATGGTLKAAISLCEKAGYEVEDVLVLINLTFLNQMKFKSAIVKSLIQYE